MKDSIGNLVNEGDPIAIIVGQYSGVQVGRIVKINGNQVHFFYLSYGKPRKGVALRAFLRIDDTSNIQDKLSIIDDYANGWMRRNQGVI